MRATPNQRDMPSAKKTKRGVKQEPRDDEDDDVMDDQKDGKDGKESKESKESKQAKPGGVDMTFQSNPFFQRKLHPILEHKMNETWRQPTNIHCWYCACSFPNPPYPLPTNYEAGVFTVMGIYCSLTCVKSHIKDMGSYYMGQRLEWLTLMAADVYNYHLPISTVDKYVFKHYGGNRDHAEYLAHGAAMPPVQIRSIPFVDLPMVFEEPFKDDEMSKMNLNPSLPPKDKDKDKDKDAKDKSQAMLSNGANTQDGAGVMTLVSPSGEEKQGKNVRLSRGEDSDEKKSSKSKTDALFGDDDFDDDGDAAMTSKPKTTKKKRAPKTKKEKDKNKNKDTDKDGEPSNKKKRTSNKRKTPKSESASIPAPTGSKMHALADLLGIEETN